MAKNLHMYEIQMDTQTTYNGIKITIRELLEHGLNNNLIFIKNNEFYCDKSILNSYLVILHDFDKADSERIDLMDFILSMVGVILAEREFDAKVNEFDKIIEELRKKVK